MSQPSLIGLTKSYSAPFVVLSVDNNYLYNNEN